MRSRRRLRPRPLVALGALAVGLLGALAGCGSEAGNADQGSPTQGPTAAELPPIEHDLGPPRYRDLLADTLEGLNEFWDKQLPDLGVEPKPPKALVSYWNRRQDEGCGGRRAGAGNAQYCSLNKTISWDGNWLYGDLYRLVGDAAVAFLLAHEYAHLVQDTLGIENDFKLTIEAELNADCLAGAWLGNVDEKVARLTKADFEALYVGVLDVADPRGVPWWDPSAHGTAKERGQALSLGARKGQRTCLRELGPGFSR